LHYAFHRVDPREGGREGGRERERGGGEREREGERGKCPSTKERE